MTNCLTGWMKITAMSTTFTTCQGQALARSFVMNQKLTTATMMITRT